MPPFNYQVWSTHLNPDDEKVDVSGFDFTITDMALLFGRLELMPNLKILFISNSNLTSAHLSQLNRLQTTLEQLSLDRNNIMDLAGLQNMMNLKYLDLSCNHVTDVTPLRTLVQLRILLLQDNVQLATLAPLVDRTSVPPVCYLSSLSRLGLNNTRVKRDNAVSEELQKLTGENNMMLSNTAAHNNGVKSPSFEYATDAEALGGWDGVGRRGDVAYSGGGETKGTTASSSPSSSSLSFSDPRDGQIVDVNRLFDSFFSSQTTSGDMDTFECDDDSMMHLLNAISKRLIERDSSSPAIKVILPSWESNPLFFPSSSLTQRWPWLTTFAAYGRSPGTVNMATTPCKSPQAFLALIEHLFGGTTKLICNGAHENLLLGMDCANFFEIPSLSHVVIEALEIELDSDNVCDILGRMTLARSPLRSRCMQLYMENPDLLEQHSSEQRLRPTLQREIHALRKALSETTSSDWKFSRESYPSSYEEMLAIMTDSINVQETVLTEQKKEFLKGKFVDATGKVIPWDSPLMKQTRERFEDQEVEIQTKRSFVQGHERLFQRIMMCGDEEGLYDAQDDDGSGNGGSGGGGGGGATTLRQISNEGRNILREALAGKWDAKARLRAKRDA